MRTTWPSLAVVAVAGTAIGIAIGALPDARPGEVAASGASDTTIEFPAAGDPSAGDPSDDESSEDTADAGASDEATADPASPVTFDEAFPAAATTVAPSTTPPPTTAAPTTTEATTTVPTTAAPTTAAPTTVPLRPTAEVRIVLANGDGRWNLVGRNVDRLTPLGYVEIDQTDIDGRYDRTTIFYRDGFAAEAARLAADLQVPGALLEPLGDRTITINDDLGDLIAVLGPDAIR